MKNSVLALAKMLYGDDVHLETQSVCEACVFVCSVQNSQHAHIFGLSDTTKAEAQYNLRNSLVKAGLDRVPTLAEKAQNPKLIEALRDALRVDCWES